jgi:hypothetical protein
MPAARPSSREADVVTRKPAPERLSPSRSTAAYPRYAESAPDRRGFLTSLGVLALATGVQACWSSTDGVPAYDWDAASGDAEPLYDGSQRDALEQPDGQHDSALIDGGAPGDGGEDAAALDAAAPDAAANDASGVDDSGAGGANG